MWHSLALKTLQINQALAAGTNPPPGGGGLNLPNPLGGTLQDVLENLLNGLLALATPVFMIMVIVSAFYFLTAGGSDDRIKTAKQILLYAVIGYGIILWAKGIALIIQEVLTSGS